MSKLGTAVGTLIEQLESHEARLDELTANVTALTANVTALTATVTALTARVAALEAQPAHATADAGFELEPIRDEAIIALAEYRRQLDDVPFSPEADGVTSAMRAEHYAAVDAVARAASWIERSGPNRDQEIYAAIGAGRKALIRLTAMLEHRPIPLPLLTAEELSGYVDAATDVHTGNRFVWEGRGDAEFLLDRPVSGKPVLLEVVPLGEDHLVLNVIHVERTDRKLEHRFSDTAGLGFVYRKMVGPEVTHLRITGDPGWRARVIQPDELPSMERETTGQGRAWFRHTLGAKKVTIQGTEGGSLEFVPDCDCKGICTDYDHRTPKSLTYHSGDFREDMTLPRRTGMLSVSMRPKSVWSVTVLHY
ncbi:hypothetical protein KGQ19_00190 [Catenulispora sp. NL8]|uniref:Uncharacterized protein n=1 Tax=Catenulispora pinistramenti TaxID=2705254 RepID=A0ABS5KIX1_9ACTN|nr:hypothetical protein [Catenulispora pinistramenti]MBS2545276.1 hypothetical protein [Catenulispora pinistramenti]